MSKPQDDLLEEILEVFQGVDMRDVTNVSLELAARVFVTSARDRDGVEMLRRAFNARLDQHLGLKYGLPN